MNTSRASSRSRYTTALPSFIAAPQHESHGAGPSQAETLVHPHRTQPELTSENSRQQSQLRKINVNHETHGVISKSDRQQAVFQTDWSLPYQRPLRNNDTRALAADLGLVGQTSSSSSDQKSSTGVPSLSEGSDSSHSNFNEHEVDNIRVAKKESVLGHNPTSSSHSSSSRPENDSDSSLSPPRSRPRIVIQESAENLTTQFEQPPALPHKSPNRPAPSQPESRPSSKNSSHPVAPYDRSLRGVAGSHSSKLKTSPATTLRKFLLRESALRRRLEVDEPRPNPIDRSPEVEYENVEGVELDTQPAAAPEKKTGLSLPEIEARDIRQIPTFDTEGGNTGQDAGAASLDQVDSFFRGSPVLAGANRQINNNTVPVRENGDTYSHAMVEDNLQVDERSTPDQIVRGSEYPTSEAVPVGEERPIRNPQVARHSSATRGSFEAPTTIPEDSRENLLDIADSNAQEAAEPPQIVLSKEFEERESRMTRSIQTAKNLISKML